MRKHRYIKMILLFFAIITLNSCYTRYASNLLQERSNLPQYEPQDYSEYRLKVSDELLIRVMTLNQELSTMFPLNANSISTAYAVAYPIHQDGTVDFPFMPKVELVGKTLDESELILENLLKNYASDAKVKLSLKTQSFCVIGESGRGYFPIYRERMTIFQALALSGGIRESGVFNKVKIIRTTSNGTIIKSFDIRTKSIINSEFYYIQPNDIIYVDMSKKKFWASGSYAEFTGLITSSLTFIMTVYNIQK